MARVVLCMPDVGVVLRPTDAVRLASPGPGRVCVGLPDLTDLSDITGAIELLEGALISDGTLAKVGFYCGHDHAGPNFLSEFLSHIATAHVSWIFEPYCNATKCFWDMRVLAEDLGCQVFWKLPIADEDECRDFESVFGRSWLLRSDGASWSTFLRGLMNASRYGCSGVMVGRAFWADLVGLPYDAILDESARRLADIRRYLGRCQHSGDQLATGLPLF